MDTNDPNDKYRKADYFKNRKCVAYYADEIFKPYPYFPNDYMIGNRGTIYNIQQNKKCGHFSGSHGYVYSVLHLNNIQIHRAILLAFNYPGDDYKEKGLKLLQVNHIDGNRLNNVYYGENDPRTNLEWCTAKENIQHSIKTGLRNQTGEDNHNTKNKLNEVELICSCMAKYKQFKLPPKMISNLTGIKYTKQFRNLVINIRNKTAWVSVSSKYGL